MTTNDGRFAIPTRIYLTAAQRSQLELLLRQHEHDLPELLSELVVALLAQQPPDPASEPAPPPATDPAALQQQIAQRRAEMRRLQARAVQGGETAPAWVQHYLAELAQEVQQLEAELHRAAPSG